MITDKIILHDLPGLGTAYLSPWTPDDKRFKRYWWHRTPFAYGPINYQNIKYIRNHVQSLG